MIEVCKVKYHLDNSFFRDHVTPELKRKIVDKSHSKKGMGPDDRFRLFVVVFLALIVIAYLIFGD